MNEDEKGRVTARSIIALLCAIWFLLVGWMWAFLANLVVAYPFGILGFFLWRNVRKHNPTSRLNRATFVILVAGLVISIGALFLYK